MIRALLCLRRDQFNEHSVAADTMELIAELETGNVDTGHLANVIATLCQQDTDNTIGRSLIGYFDYPSMGNLTMYLTSSKNIKDALLSVKKYQHQLFPDSPNVVIQEQDGTIMIELPTPSHHELTALLAYFYLALFRHLAGRQFDFKEVKSPVPGQQLLSAISQCKLHKADVLTLTFEKRFLDLPSFFYSAQIKAMLGRTLVVEHTQPLIQQIQAVFERSTSPVRLRVEGVATQLGMGEVSLRRQLKQDSLAFNQLLKHYIHDRACRMLLTGTKPDEVAATLGFADRRSFDRSFKELSGINAAQVRMLSNRLRFQRGNSQLSDVVEHLPPLPDTLKKLIKLPDEQLTVANVVAIVERDPVLHAFLMSKASKAIYGAAPSTLEQAIGRNLGVGNIKNLALIFLAQQGLGKQSRFNDIDALLDCMLLAERLHSSISPPTTDDERQASQQVMLFGMLSLLLLFHEDCIYASGSMAAWKQAKIFNDFSSHLLSEYGLCIYGASSLMLMRWGMTGTVNQRLWQLCQQSVSASEQPPLALIKLCHELAFTRLMTGEVPSAQACRQSGILNDIQVQRSLRVFESA